MKKTKTEYQKWVGFMRKLDNQLEKEREVSRREESTKKVNKDD